MTEIIQAWEIGWRVGVWIAFGLGELLLMAWLVQAWKAERRRRK
jgi:hypothetical protein